MRYLFFTFFVLLFFTAWSQSGNYFLAHYSPNKNKFHNVCFDMVQDERGFIYFATRSGILQFDGRDWSQINSSGAIYSLQLTKTGAIYWGGASGFGTITNDSYGLPQLVTQSEGIKDVIQSVAVNGKLFFLNDKNIFIVTPGQEAIKTLKANQLTGSFNSIFELFGVVHVNTEKGGIYKVSNGDLVRSTLPLSKGDQIIFSVNHQNNYLLGVSNNKLFICGEDLKLREVKLEDQEYANASVIVNGKWVNRDLFVLGTLRGGMMFIHAPTGKTQEIINYSTGLPDNEVFALLHDKNQCIWAAHEYGFTRVAPYLPFRSFSHYPGLQGNLLCARSYQNDIYVGTSLGLFKLEKEDIYEEIAYYVDVVVKNPKKKAAASPPPDPALVIAPKEEDIIAAENESKKKGFFRFLRKKRTEEKQPVQSNKNESSQTEIDTRKSEEQKPSGELTPEKTQIKRVLKTEKVFRASHFIYKKIAGIDSKITQLIEINGKLIAAGVGGTYEIKENSMVRITETPTRYVYASEKNILFIATYSDELKAFKQYRNEWNPLTILQNLDDQINYIFDGHGNEIWLCALDKIYRLILSGDEIQDIKIIEIANRNFDEFVGLRWHDDIILTNAEGFFRFDKNQNTFISIDTLTTSRILSYFAHNNRVWYRDLHSWNLFGSTLGESNLRLFNLFESLRFISPDQDPENLWIITSTNELYKFFGERLTPYQSSFPMVLKTVRNDNMKSGELSNLKIDQENSAIVFEIVQPDYLAPGAIEYRYLLKGLDESWSDWSTSNNIIDFPYLPAGDYTLLVQSQDIFGHFQDMRGVTFEVLPPYWKRPWFYALEFFVFAFLVVLSFRLSARYLIISRILMLLTIIMLIQFVQTVVGETFETRASPVIDFFVQVLIAIIILPAEEYLRNMVMRSLDYPLRLYGMRSSKAQPEMVEENDDLQEE